MIQKVAFVTGGSDRIGKGIAIQLAKLGYNILLHYNSSKERAEKTQQEIQALGVICETVQLKCQALINYAEICSKALTFIILIKQRVVFNYCVVLNFGVRQDWATFFEQISSRFDIEILVNNASDFSLSDFSTPSVELLFHHFQINFVSAYGLTKAFSQQKDKGLIINLLDAKIAQNDTKHLDYVLSKKHYTNLLK